MNLDFITSNEHKFREISRYLEKTGIECKWIRTSYEEIQADTTEEISRDSAEKISGKRSGKFFLEDTGLYIESLRGFPGPYSSYVLRTISNRGILNLLNGMDRSAHFLTVISYFDGSQVRTFTGKLEGHISMESRGSTGFGYDPIFIPEGNDRTLGEMDVEEKNRNSHRINALKKFIDFLE
ncbi:MAG: XTP/dITP diphosphatase [Cuniculiplasma sp.]